MNFPGWIACTCHWIFWASNRNFASASISRCSSSHARSENFELPDSTYVTASSLLVVILSHEANKHNGRYLKDLLLQKGVRAANLKVVFGATFEDCYHGDRKVKGNEVCMFSFRFKWLRRVHDILQERPNKYNAVMYLENTASPAFHDSWCWFHVFSVVECVCVCVGHTANLMGHKVGNATSRLYDLLVCPI